MGESIRKDLERMQDLKYRSFQARLIPTVDPDTIIGVRTPELRKYARDMLKNGMDKEFLTQLPHHAFEENQLHAFILSEIRDYSRCIEELEHFLPWVDNWATCDQMTPRAFHRAGGELRERIQRWISSEKTYTVRFGIRMLMQHYLGERFDSSCLELVAGLRSQEYYINMMIAWYFATALAKQYDAALPFIEQGRLERWTHNRAIQKALESFRVPEDRKTYLRSLRLRPGKQEQGPADSAPCF